MAEIAFVKSEPFNGVIRHTWPVMGAADTGKPLTPRGAGALAGCLQVTAGTVTLQGSNDGVTWATLNDIAGAALSAKAVGLYEFGTAALYIRPIRDSGSAECIIVLRG